MLLPVIAMDNQRVADVERDANLRGVERFDGSLEFGEVATEISCMACGRMVLQQGAQAQFTIQRGKFFKLRMDLRIKPLERPASRSTNPRR